MSNEFYINIENKPKWINGVSFSNQSRDVQEFYINEAKKLKNGLTLGGVKIHPWLYWHVNFWSIFVDKSATERKLTRPELRDNEWYWSQLLLEAEKDRKGIILFGTRRFGKALKDSEGIMYSNGVYRPIGDAKIGDKIYGGDGKLTSIIGVYPQGELQLYNVNLQDGRSVECSEDHLWEVFDYQAQTYKTLPLKEIVKRYKFNRYYKKRDVATEVYNYYIPLTKPIEFTSNTLKIDPYFLGLWIGDGSINSTRITTEDNEIVDYIYTYVEKLGMSVTPDGNNYRIVNSKGKSNYLINSLRELNIYSNKRIPNIYLTSSVNDRLELLRGLMDSDGYISKGGTITFTQTKKDLFKDVYKLLLELGIKSELIEDYETNYLKEGKLLTSNKINIFTDKPIFKLKRKLDRLNNKSNRNRAKIDLVAIVNIEKTTKSNATCIRVDNKDSLFITKDAIVTHNSAFISSYIAYNATMKYGSFNSVVGGAQGDLDNVTSYIDIGLENVPEFFKYNKVGVDWSKGVTLGTRTKGNKRNIFSTMTVTNVDSGKVKSSQKTAGATPTSFVIDEIGKFPVKKTFNAAKYSFSTPYGWRVTPILIGTGGETSLSQDAQTLLAKPSVNNLIEMNWRWLDDYADKPTWEKKTWGIFVPAQMSIEPGLLKKETNLADYLKIDNKFLKKINVKSTQWKQSTKILQDRRDALEKDRDALTDEMMFLPLTPDDCFLQSGENPFPTIVGRNHINKLIESGNTGKPVELYREDGKVKHKFSNKTIAEFPFEGGNIDAPVLLFETPPLDNSIDSTYVAGLDHYKHDKASTDSVGSLYVFKRKVNLDGFANHIVASYCSRPTSIDKFNAVAELVIEAFGSVCLQENADVSFEQHLRRKNKAAIWLAQGEELARKYANPKSTQNNKYGLVPNTKNKNYLLGLVISYAQEDIDLGEDKDGNRIIMKGIERINDLALLEEMVEFKYGNNHDRITAFGHALAWARYLDDLHIIPKVKQKTDTSAYRRQVRKEKLKYRSPYSRSRGNLYRK